MTCLKASIAPSNSLLVLCSAGRVAVPDSLGEGGFASTPSCLVVGTLTQIDGETAVVLTDEPYDPGEGELLVFEGCLETLDLQLRLTTVLDETVLKLGVREERTDIRVWANDRVEPNYIAFVVV